MREYYKIKTTKPNRGYVIMLDTGVHLYEMQLSEQHIELATQGKMLLIDSTNMTIYDPKRGGWFKMYSYSEIVEYERRRNEAKTGGQRNPDQCNQGQNTRASTRNRKHKKSQEESKT